MIGVAVSRGLVGTNVAVGSKDIGFVWARKGARPVAVGPAHNSGLVWKYWGTVVVGAEHLERSKFSGNRGLWAFASRRTLSARMVYEPYKITQAAVTTIAFFNTERPFELVLVTSSLGPV